jgi:hypothetical protein
MNNFISKASRTTALTAAALMSLLSIPSITLAQNFQGSLDFIVGLPQGEFRSNVDRAGFGLEAAIGYAPQASPFMVGFDLQYLNYGDETRRERFSTTIPDVTVDVSTTNNIAMGHLFARLQPNEGFFRPYLEGLIGLNYLFTTTKISNRGTGEEVASSTNFDDAAFSYGGGAGAMFLVYEAARDDRDAGITEVLVNVRVRYMLGGEAEYLKEGSIRRENGQVAYDISKSKTNLMTLHIGVALRF